MLLAIFQYRVKLFISFTLIELVLDANVVTEVSQHGAHASGFS